MNYCPNCGLPTPHNGPCPGSHPFAEQELCSSCGKPVGHAGACDLAEEVFAIATQSMGQVVAGNRQGTCLQGRYQILHMIGQGGMGTVYLALDMRLANRQCVVKQLRDDIYKEEDKAKALSFFQREMETLSKLEHPNIVRILDYFNENNTNYLVMERIDGSDLYTIVKKDRRGEPFAENEVVNWALQITEVLQYLHQQNVIYRDLKPSNIMTDLLSGQIKLIDFGIARPYDDRGEGTHVVSAGYSPPEQYWGGACPQSDIYALGATMHFLLTGTDPEPLHASCPALANKDVSDYISAVVEKATTQDINERYASAEEMHEALLARDFVSAPDTPRSRIGEIAVAIVLLIGAFLLYLGPQLFESGDSGKPGVVLPGHKDTPESYLPANPSSHVSDLDRSGPVRTGGEQSELARQVTDEKDLTDPQR